MEFLGIDIGGTKCAVLRATAGGDVLEKEKFPTAGVDETLGRILDAAKRLKGGSAAAGISCGGPLDAEKGIILSPPNLPGWDNIEIVKICEKELGIPVFLSNDADACALAEWKFGAGRGSRNMIFLTFGTGMGAGLILDGKIYRGASGCAGEVGHIRLEKFGPAGYGKQGSFEGFASGGGIAMLGKISASEALQRGERPAFCKSLSEIETVSAKSIAEAAFAGDKTAIGVYETVGEALGRGLSVLIDILNPDRIVIGSIYQRSAELMQEAMERVIEQETLPASRAAVSIVKAELGDEIGDFAAIATAAEGWCRGRRPRRPEESGLG